MDQRLQLQFCAAFEADIYELSIDLQRRSCRSNNSLTLTRVWVDTYMTLFLAVFSGYKNCLITRLVLIAVRKKYRNDDIDMMENIQLVLVHNVARSIA